MDVKNCRKCGKIFNYITGPVICPACKEAEDSKFQEAKKYVSEHKGVTISELAEAIEVETNTIRQWLREERLQFADDSAIGLECEKCGAMIRSGRYCDACKAGMANAFGSMYQQPGSSPAPRKDDKTGGPKMRFV